MNADEGYKYLLVITQSYLKISIIEVVEAGIYGEYILIEIAPGPGMILHCMWVLLNA